MIQLVGHRGFADTELWNMTSGLAIAWGVASLLLVYGCEGKRHEVIVLPLLILGNGYAMLVLTTPRYPGPADMIAFAIHATLTLFCSWRGITCLKRPAMIVGLIGGIIATWIISAQVTSGLNTVIYERYQWQLPQSLILFLLLPMCVVGWVIVFAAHVAVAKKQRALRLDVCISCGYDLRGTAVGKACPECGDANDDRSAYTVAAASHA